MVGRVLPTAMCVRGVDDLCVLQFTLVNAAGCALHRRTSRVIHRIELYFGFREAAGATTNLQCSHTESIPPSPEEEEDDDVCAVASRAGPVKEPTPCSKQIGETTD